jgi:hypothetical protein
MAGVWKIGNHIKVQGINKDFKILSYPLFLAGA